MSDSQPVSSPPPYPTQASWPSPPPPSPGRVPAVRGAGPLRAIGLLYRRYAKFDGAAGRAEFWWATLYLGLVLPLAIVLVSAGIVSVSGEPDAANAVAGVLLMLWLFGHIVPGIALWVRRLHDVGLSGWLVLVNFVPFVGNLALTIIAVLPPSPTSRYR